MSLRATVLATLVGLAGCSDEVVGYLVSDSESSDGTESGGAASDELPDFVAIGYEQTIVASFDDGRTWTAAEEPTKASPDIVREGLAHGPARVVIVGGPETLVSPDGLTWTRFGDELGYARAAAWGAGTFVSVGLGRRARSVDGEGWVDTRDGDFDFDFQAVAYGDGRFVAVGSDVLGTSTDGDAWEVTPIAGSKLHAVAFGNGRFIAVSEEGRIAITFDGTTFASDEMTSGFYDGIVFCQGEFAALSGSTVRLSPDGEEWRELAIEPAWSVACGVGTVVSLHEDRLRRGPDLMEQDPVHTAPTPLHRVAFTGETPG